MLAWSTTERQNLHVDSLQNQYKPNDTTMNMIDTGRCFLPHHQIPRVQGMV